MRGKLTYANVISTLCLFMLLGGGAYAATQLPKNSVGAKQIKNGAITGKEIKKGTIDASKLTASAVATLKGTKGDLGPVGPQGTQGLTNGGAFASVAVGEEIVFVGDHPGFAAVEKAQEGVYCLTPTSGTNIDHPIASVDLANSGGEKSKFVEPLANGAVVGCDPGRLEVHTLELLGEPLVLEPSNAVAFTVFAPGT
ncbi:MAG TPA: hypothetical protein VFI03_07760 [Solirubrobacterales bacterium]|nr:hypothetical protein [Solirubrobacterales bacterium]